MPKYYKIYDDKEIVFLTVDESGSYIIKDVAGRKVFLSKYQVKLMKLGVESLAKELLKDNDATKIHIEEIKPDK